MGGLVNKMTDTLMGQALNVWSCRHAGLGSHYGCNYYTPFARAHLPTARSVKPSALGTSWYSSPDPFSTFDLPRSQSISHALAKDMGGRRREKAKEQQEAKDKETAERRQKLEQDLMQT